MLEYKVLKPMEKKEGIIYEPLRDDLNRMYGNIDLYSVEKRFASAKCCMCCH